MSTIYLYIKTHNITGLKYLGKTNSADPHKYTGSGIYWTRHLKKNGKDYSTTILRECQSNDEVKEWGKYYSELWNVVDSKEWANLTEEEGAGGDPGPDGRKKISESKLGKEPWNKGKTGIYSEETKAQISNSLKGKPSYIRTPETLEKQSVAQKKIKRERPKSFDRTGCKNTPESNAKRSATLKGRKVSEETREKMRLAALKRYGKI